MENSVMNFENRPTLTPFQKKLNNLLDDQLEKLREKDKLTQYDLDMLNAKY